MIKVIRPLLPKDQIFYCAVSMGVDSLAAAYFMYNKGYKIIPIHFNHALREQNNVMAEKFMDFCSEKLNAQGYVGFGTNLKTEAECRDARIQFYRSIAVSGGVVVTAHHLNDWVESYLLNCFRGHPNHNSFELCSNFGSFSICHPFLLSRKKDFIEYVDRNDLRKYTVEDETNSMIKGSRRNWLRNCIVPEMTKQKLSLEKFAKRQVLQLVSDINQST
jgi:tRNA(Ile)-lysidine synthase TilS/MesJ